MQRDAQLYFVQHPEDLPETNALLGGLSSPTNGRVVVTITPDGRNLHWLAQDLLRALGKDLDRAGSVRNGQESFEQAVAWLIAQGVTDLFVSRAHLLDRGRWETLLELGARCGLSVWLIAQTPSLRRGHRETLREWPIAVVDHDAFVDHCVAMATGGSQPAETPTRTQHGSRPVPADDFTTFRASCRRLLDAEHFAALDERFSSSRTRLADWLAANTDVGASDFEERLALELRALTTDADGADQVVAALRGAQAACFLVGVLVKVHIDRFVAQASSQSTVAALDVLAQARLYASPRHAAILALSGGCRLTATQITAIDVGDISGDVSYIEIAGARVPVSAEVRPFVVAQLLDRQRQGAGEHDPLFVTQTGGANDVPPGETPRLTTRALQQTLRKLSGETGLLLAGHWTNHARNEERHWMRRHGISVTAL